MKLSYLTVAISLVLLTGCSQSSTLPIDSSISSSSALAFSSVSSTDSTEWVEAQKVEWRDAEGMYWKLPASFASLDSEGNPQAKLLSSNDGESWNDATGNSWKAIDGKRYKFGWSSQKTNDAALPSAKVLEIWESVDDGKTWQRAYDSIAWSGSDGHKFQFGAGGSVWTQK